MATEILLPSAVHLEERLTVSQSVPEPASRQSDTHRLGFLSVADAAPSSRKALCYNSSSGRAAMQPAGIPVVGGSNPSADTLPPPAAANVAHRIRTDACKFGVGCVTIGPLAVLPALCVPTACSLLSKNF